MNTCFPSWEAKTNIFAFFWYPGKWDNATCLTNGTRQRMSWLWGRNDCGDWWKKRNQIATCASYATKQGFEQIPGGQIPSPGYEIKECTLWNDRSFNIQGLCKMSCIFNIRRSPTMDHSVPIPLSRAYRKILVSQTTDFHFVSLHFVSQTTVSRRI